MMRVERVDLTTDPEREREPLSADCVVIRPDANGVVFVLVYGVGEPVPTAYAPSDWCLTIREAK